MLGGRSSPPKWSAEFCGCGEDPNTCKIPAEYPDDNTIFHLNPSGGRSSPPKCSAEFCGCGEDPKTFFPFPDENELIKRVSMSVDYNT
ncbi:hypothetical protein JHK87_052624 [Glycine soja]|nr:hypothetical protein JHK87_052624 [Glycine soja]